MSKKNRKKLRSNEIAGRNNTTTASSITQHSAEFNPDYSYVIKDLKRIGTLAVFFLTILVVLSFILR